MNCLERYCHVCHVGPISRILRDSVPGSIVSLMTEYRLQFRRIDSRILSYA
jgi:hypothetical protein